MPDIITVKDIHKEYKVAKYQKTFRGLLKNLVNREYRIVSAVRNVDFTVEKGACVGFIGPNGAGKSTTIKMMTGVLHPTSGSINVNGIIPYQNRTQHARQIGVVFGQRSQLWTDLPVIDSYELIKEMYQIPAEVYQENLEVFKDKLGIGEFLDQPVRKLSLGQRMRADFAASLLHNPQVVFLDEPTIGLDVFAKEAVREFIRYIHRERGVTVILTTHDMIDIEAVCERVLIIDKGMIIHDSSMQALKESYAKTRTIEIEFTNPELAQQFAEDGSLIRSIDVQLLSHQDGIVTLQFEKDALSSFELAGRIDTHYPVKDIQTIEVPIETIIRNIYETGSLVL